MLQKKGRIQSSFHAPPLKIRWLLPKCHHINMTDLCHLFFSFWPFKRVTKRHNDKCLQSYYVISIFWRRRRPSVSKWFPFNNFCSSWPISMKFLNNGFLLKYIACDSKRRSLSLPVRKLGTQRAENGIFICFRAITFLGYDLFPWNLRTIILAATYSLVSS